MKTEYSDVLKVHVIKSGVNDNKFFERFKSAPPTKEQVTKFAQQYYYYIRTFPQILAGLSHRVGDERVRLQLAKTVVSELGAGHGPAHYKMFEDVLSAVDVQLEPLDDAQFTPEAVALVDGLREIFLKEHPDVAVGGHYAIEETGLPMIDNLYKGFRQMPGSDVDSMAYFYLHLILESAHVDWIADAVNARADTQEARARLAEGNRRVVELLQNFWNGIYNLVYEDIEIDMFTLEQSAKTAPIAKFSLALSH